MLREKDENKWFDMISNETEMGHGYQGKWWPQTKYTSLCSSFQTLSHMGVFCTRRSLNRLSFSLCMRIMSSVYKNTGPTPSFQVCSCSDLSFLYVLGRCHSEEEPSLLNLSVWNLAVTPGLPSGAHEERTGPPERSALGELLPFASTCGSPTLLWRRTVAAQVMHYSICLVTRPGSCLQSPHSPPLKSLGSSSFSQWRSTSLQVAERSSR